jgi:hypothetical protein
LKRAKKLLPYIDIGEANKMMASAKKQKKEVGKKPPPGKGKGNQPTSSAKFLAPARIQSFPSFLILCILLIYISSFPHRLAKKIKPIEI